MLYESLKRFGYPVERLQPSQQTRLKSISARLSNEGKTTVPQEAVSLLLNFHSLNEAEFKVLEQILFETNRKSLEENDRKFSLVNKDQWWTNWGRSKETGRAIGRNSLISQTKIASQPEVVWRELGAPRATGESLTQQTASLLHGFGGNELGKTLRSCYGEQVHRVLLEEGGVQREVVLLEDLNKVGNSLGVFVKLALACAQANGVLDSSVALAAGDAPRNTDVVVRSLIGADRLLEAAPQFNRFVGSYVLISVRADLD